MTPLIAAIDPWILAFSAVTVIATVWMGFRSAKTSKTASDFFVAGRSVSVGWNASAISGEYLSAASFMGVAGMVMSSGYDALWYPVCYACGYLFLLLFIAGPLRRFGAYTIPDFAEGRFDSPVFRKIAVVFVLFIGFFYTMPQMKGAGTTLAYIFPGLPYWAGVVLVGAVITLNVALGGMKGITLVQAFQYWAKMFAISVPIFVLMAVYGNYGKQVGFNGVDIPIRAIHVPPNVAWVETTYSKQRPNTGVSPWTRVRIWWSDYRRRRQPNPAAYSFGPSPTRPCLIHGLLSQCMEVTGTRYVIPKEIAAKTVEFGHSNTLNGSQWVSAFEQALQKDRNLALIRKDSKTVYVVPQDVAQAMTNTQAQVGRQPLSSKAPPDATWLNPFGPLTTKAAKAAKPELTYTGKLLTEEVTVGGDGPQGLLRFVAGKFDQRGRIQLGDSTRDALLQFKTYAIITVAKTPGNVRRQLRIEYSPAIEGSRIQWKQSAPLSERELAERFRQSLETNGITVVREPGNVFKAFLTKDAIAVPVDTKPYALLYTYSLIIALVCGTAGLPHILVRFYTNPDGVAAKRTTMWVMILIGVFYVFPPVFGVMGRNLLPSLYEGVGAKGTDKVVLELPRILNEGKVGKGESEKVGGATNGASLPPAHSPTGSLSVSSPTAASKGIPWGSILSGITCAGAFAAFMSTFSGLLVSMTGAMAHDVYGRMLNPKATPQQRLRAFKIAAVIIGGVAILLGMQVEPLQINFMVGQAFAIAAASYFPLLFMSAWWRGMTTKGAAVGMLAGGLFALIGISLTSFSDLSIAGGATAKLFAAFRPLNDFWAAHPLLRILCEQPAIWTVPLAIALMVVVSKLTRREVPADIRMKMLVLHAPEKLGLKQEYIQEHQHGH